MGTTPGEAPGRLKIIGLEEHVATRDVLAAWRDQGPLMEDMTMRWSVAGPTAAALTDLGEGRIQAMDDAGVDVAVLSLTTPGLQALPTRQAVALQGPTNDIIADAVRRHPDRFQGFATLATPDPAAAARELHRAMTDLGLNGVMLHARSGDHLIDEQQFWDIFEVAAHHRAPVYLHPGITLPSVDAAYYAGFEDRVGGLLKSGAPGWHYQTGIVLLRLILSGIFDRFPDLQVILGHWGEMVLFYLDRIGVLDHGSTLQRPVAEYFTTNVHITSGGIPSHRYLRWAAEVVGADRLMHATDYPYNNQKGGQFARTFLDSSSLDQHDRQAVASGNWERIVAGIQR